ncbi:MAG: hypothetical protein R2747_22075 [Pyrinomonadaceae bacterium]
MYRSLFFTVLFFCFAAGSVFAQTGKLILKENTPGIGSKPTIAKEISEDDWSKLESALIREDWNASSLLAKQYLGELNLENNDGQIARLRYIYVYSLAGRIITDQRAGHKADEVKTRDELERTLREFTGERFIFPVRKILANCEGVVNYVCESKENPGFLRVAATNPDGNAIHSFEYIDMHLSEKSPNQMLVDVVRHDKKDIIFGGFLKGFRFKSGEAYKGVVVLEFENGFVKEIYGK